MIVQWTRMRTIVGLSLPVVLMLLAQPLASLITIALVSPLGDAAVAGIGIAGAVLSALIAMLFGIDTGVQALVAQRIGAGQSRLAGVVVNDALAIALTAGLLLAVTGYCAAPGLFSLITRDATVTARGLSYLNAALPTLLFVGANFAFSAYRNGAGMPRYSLLVAVVQVPCNALFSSLLIFGAPGLPRLETAGAGLGASLAALAGLAVHLVLATRIAPIPGLFTARPGLVGMLLILKIGLPVGLQQSLVYLGVAVYFAIIGPLGTAAVAAMNVVLSVMLLSILPAAGMGIGAATLVGMALGRGDPSDARRWGWETAWLGALAILAFSLVVIAVPRDMLGLFISDPATVDLATTPLRVMALGMSIDAFGRILGFALRGASATRLVTAVGFTLQWAMQLPLAWLVGVQFGLGLIGIAVSQLLIFATETTIVAMLWRRTGLFPCAAPQN